MDRIGFAVTGSLGDLIACTGLGAVAMVQAIALIGPQTRRITGSPARPRHTATLLLFTEPDSNRCDAQFRQVQDHTATDGGLWRA